MQNNNHGWKNGVEKIELGESLQRKTILNAKIGNKFIIGKSNDAKFITYYSLVQKIAFDFQVICHEYFIFYYYYYY